jgi:hypothetical protein
LITTKNNKKINEYFLAAKNHKAAGIIWIDIRNLGRSDSNILKQRLYGHKGRMDQKGKELDVLRYRSEFWFDLKNEKL